MKKNHSAFSGFIKSSVVALATIAFLAGGFFVPSSALAFTPPGSVNINVATGGGAVSIDTTSISVGGTGTYTSLRTINISETAPGQITAGIHTISLPNGWEFNTSAHITADNGDGLVLDSYEITPDLTSFSFNVITASNESTFVSLAGLKVRPQGTIAPSTGVITHSGVPISGVTDGSTSFGTLTTVPSNVAKVVFTTQPGTTTVYGSNLSTQPVVKTQDHFGNDSTIGLGASKMVTLSLSSGTGALQGTASLDIGTGTGNGTVTFTGLTVDEFGAGKQLTASADSLTLAVSTAFEITKKTLTATVTGINKTYDGNNSATFTDPIPVGVEFSDVLTISGGPETSATFTDINVGPSKTVTATGLTLNGANAGNYTYDGTATGTADITPLEITITPTASQTKVYGEVDPTFTYTFNPALISSDVFTGALSRVAGSNVGSYDYTLGDLSAGSNYSLVLGEGTFAITQRPITVTAVTNTKVYDGNTSSIATPTIVVGSLATGDTANFIQIYSNTTVGTGKWLTPSGTVNDGNNGNNYSYTFSPTHVTSGVITAKSLTISGLSATSKPYDGNTSAGITGTPSLVGIVSGDTVTLEGSAIGTFSLKDVGTRSVAVSGFTLGGISSGNYTLTEPTLSADIMAKVITITPNISQTKVYGEVDPTFTYTFDPALINPDVFTGVLSRVAGSNVGSYAYTLGDLSAGSNYSLVLGAGTFEITPKSITVTANPEQTKVYNTTDPTFSYTTNPSLISGDSFTGSLTRDEGENVGIYAITQGSVSAGGNYAISFASNDFAITKATPVITWANPSDIVYGTALSGTQLNASTPVAGAFVYTPASGVVLDAGAGQILSTTFTPTDTANYNLVTQTATINVTKATPVITWANPSDIVYGTALSGTQLNASTPVAGAFVYTPVSGVVLDAGAGQTLSTTFTPTDTANYNSVTQTATINVAQKPLTVTATGIDKAYDGTTDATVTLSSDKLSGDTVTLVNTSAIFTDNKNVGDGKPITVSGISISGADAGNYSLTNITATTTANITIKALTATVTVADKIVDGNTTATITNRTPVGVASGDTIVLGGGTATFDNANVGNNKIITASGLTISSGNDLGNYSYDGTATGTGNILPIPTVVYVDDDYSSAEGDAGSHTFGYDAFSTIQNGITAVDVGGTVNVAVGTYTETVSINKSISLLGIKSGVNPNDESWDDTRTDTANESIIHGAVNFGLRNNIVMDGFTIERTDINEGHILIGGDLIGVGATSQFTIQNNRIIGSRTSATAWGGIHSNLLDNYPPGPYTDPGKSATIQNNRIVIAGTGSSNGINIRYLVPGTNNTSHLSLTGNYIGAIDPIPGDGINLVAVETTDGLAQITGNHLVGSNIALYRTEGVNIANNELISPPEDAIWLMGGDHNITIGDNIITGGTDSAIKVDNISTRTNSGVTITNNTLQNNDYGIFIAANSVTDTVAVHTNKITGNMTNGIFNDSSSGGSVNATQNWWSSIEGPTITSNPHGNGNSIVGTVTYASWCIEADCDPYDTTTPTATLTGTPVALTKVTTADITVGGTGVIYYKYKLAGDVSYGVETAVVDHISLSGLSGSQTLSVIGRDQSGNWQSSDSATSYTWTVDTGVPTLSTVTIASDNSTSTLAKVGNTVTLTIVSSENIQTPTAIIAGQSATIINGSDAQHWTATYVMASGDTEGVVSFMINFSDLAGNLGEQNVVSEGGGSVTFDKTAPIVSIDSPDADARVNATAVIAFSNDSDLTPTVAECSVNNSVWVTCTSGTTTLTSITGFAGLSQGIFTLYLRDTDTAENIGTTQVALVKDTLAPSLTGKTPSAGAVGIDPATDVTVTFSENVVITDTEVTLQKSGSPAVNTVVTFDSGSKIATINPAVTLDNNSTYTVTLTGVTDTALNTLSTTSWVFTTSASYSMSLTNGWNLISLPVVPVNTNIGTVLGSLNDSAKIETVWEYDPSGSGTWRSYHPGNSETSDSLFTTMTAGEGYWINYLASDSGVISGTGNLFQAGNSTPPQKTLEAGWNLIGYYQLENIINTTATKALSTVAGQWTQLRTYSNTDKQFQSVIGSGYMKPGEGYWIFMKSSSYAPYLYGPGDAD